MKRENLTIGGALAVFVCLLLLGSHMLQATDIFTREGQAFDTRSNLVLSASNSGTNHPNATNSIWIEPNLYHTIVVSITCTDSTTVTLDRTLDQSVWIPFSTNTATSSASSELTLLGKWSYVRGRFAGSNASCSVIYLGGR